MIASMKGKPTMQLSQTKRMQVNASLSPMLACGDVSCRSTAAGQLLQPGQHKILTWQPPHHELRASQPLPAAQQLHPAGSLAGLHQPAAGAYFQVVNDLM